MISGSREFGLLGLILVGTCILAGNAVAGEWKRIAKEDGVTVTSKEVSGRDLPIFRGITTFRASIYDVLTVLDDVPRRVEWVHRCIRSQGVKRVSDFRRIIYNRTDAPWPVSDRDVVVRTQAIVNTEKRTVKIAFRSVRGHRGKTSGVVRIPRLIGFYYLESLAEKKTRVTYQIDTDPGGWLPNWIIKLASKKIPLKTLLNLRRQIVKVRTSGSSARIRDRWIARLRQETNQIMVPRGEAPAQSAVQKKVPPAAPEAPSSPATPPGATPPVPE